MWAHDGAVSRKLGTTGLGPPRQAHPGGEGRGPEGSEGLPLQTLLSLVGLGKAEESPSRACGGGGACGAGSPGQSAGLGGAPEAGSEQDMVTQKPSLLWVFTPGGEMILPHKGCETSNPGCHLRPGFKTSELSHIVPARPPLRGPCRPALSGQSCGCLRRLGRPPPKSAPRLPWQCYSRFLSKGKVKVGTCSELQDCASGLWGLCSQSLPKRPLHAGVPRMSRRGR